MGLFFAQDKDENSWPMEPNLTLCSSHPALCPTESEDDMYGLSQTAAALGFPGSLAEITRNT